MPKAKSLREAKLEKDLEKAKRMIDILVADKNKLEEQYATLQLNFSQLCSFKISQIRQLKILTWK